MKRPLALALLAPLLLTSTSCSHGVKTLSGRHRQPINVGTAVAPATATPQASAITPPVEAEPAADVSATAAGNPSPSDAGCPALASSPSEYAEIEYRVFFDFGQAALHVPDSMRADLLAAARSAARIRVKGRTDGTAYAPGDERIALYRALAMRDYLVKQGVDATRVELQFASAADYLADNSTPEGRAKNRRVEVVIEPAHG